MSTKKNHGGVRRVYIAVFGLCAVFVSLAYLKYGAGDTDVLGVSTSIRSRFSSLQKVIQPRIQPAKISAPAVSVCNASSNPPKTCSAGYHCSSSTTAGTCLKDTVGTEGEGCGGTSNQQCRQDLICISVCGVTGQFGGVCTKKNVFSVTPTPTSVQLMGKTDSACKRTGCSGQTCASISAPDLASTCQWKAAYACYQAADCVKQANDTCGFTQTETLTTCLQNAQ